MTIDPALSQLAKPLEEGQDWPRPSCPSCDSGFIRFGEPEAKESQQSEAARSHPAFEPEWVHGTFMSTGSCENPTCQQTLYAVGDYSVGYAKEAWWDYEAGPRYSMFFKVAGAHPALAIMPTPTSAPAEVREGIDRASRVLFADPGLAATALRATIERFLASQGIRARGADGRFRSVDVRIKEWSAADSRRPQVADLLFAVKWLGNAGTHEDSTLTAIEVLDGARVLDEAFHRIFTSPEIDEHAQSINLQRGPIRRT